VCNRVWIRYRRTKAVSLRNWLIQHYLPLVPRQPEEGRDSWRTAATLGAGAEAGPARPGGV